jgi:hypothetical protein
MVMDKKRGGYFFGKIVKKIPIETEVVVGVEVCTSAAVMIQTYFVDYIGRVYWK